MIEDTGWKCKNCGNFNVKVNICQRCGKEKGFKPKQTLVCPKCNKDDKIERVSAIVKKDTRTRRETSWIEETYKDNKGREQTIDIPITHEIIEISELAKELLPPEKPQLNEGVGCEIFSNVIMFVFLFTLSLFITAISISSREPSQSNTRFVAIFGGSLGVLALIFLIRIIMNIVNNNKTNRQVIEVDIPRWNYAINNWSQAYYCYRDGIVFVPGRGWAYSSQMNNLLYEDESPFYKDS